MTIEKNVFRCWNIEGLFAYFIMVTSPPKMAGLERISDNIGPGVERVGIPLCYVSAACAVY